MLVSLLAADRLIIVGGRVKSPALVYFGLSCSLIVGSTILDVHSLSASWMQLKISLVTLQSMLPEYDCKVRNQAHGRCDVKGRFAVEMKGEGGVTHTGAVTGRIWK